MKNLYMYAVLKYEKRDDDGDFAGNVEIIQKAEPMLAYDKSDLDKRAYAKLDKKYTEDLDLIEVVAIRFNDR